LCRGGGSGDFSLEVWTSSAGALSPPPVWGRRGACPARNGGVPGGCKDPGNNREEGSTGKTRLTMVSYGGVESRLRGEYGQRLVFLGVARLLSRVILGLSRLVAPQAPDAQKLAAYECGFDPFGDARSRFDVRFYLVAILFLIFDLEASFLFPWSVSLSETGSRGFWRRRDFLVELTVGYVYAWKVGALEWA